MFSIGHCVARIVYTNGNMKLFIICSKAFYNRIPPIQSALEHAGHEITLPNSYDNPAAEDHYRQLGEKEHAARWYVGM